MPKEIINDTGAQTRALSLKAQDGTDVIVCVPTGLPDQERAEVLRGLYEKYVKHPDGHWKGAAVAIVSPSIVSDVEEAMNFMGSIVDDKEEVSCGPWVRLSSMGYWAHGF